MPRSPVDQEDFLAWLEQPVTRWAREQFRVRAVALAGQRQEYLLNSAASAAPAEWAEAQPKAAHLLGLCEGLMQFAVLDYSAVREETEDEIAEMEKNAE